MAESIILFHAYSPECISKWVGEAEEQGKYSGLKVLTIRGSNGDLYRCGEGYVRDTFESVQSKDTIKMLRVEFTINGSARKFWRMLEVHYAGCGIEMLDKAFDDFVLEVEKGESVAEDVPMDDSASEGDPDGQVVDQNLDSDDSDYNPGRG